MLLVSQEVLPAESVSSQAPASENSLRHHWRRAVRRLPLLSLTRPSRRRRRSPMFLAKQCPQVIDQWQQPPDCEEKCTSGEGQRQTVSQHTHSDGVLFCCSNRPPLGSSSRKKVAQKTCGRSAASAPHSPTTTTNTTTSAIQLDHISERARLALAVH